MTNWPKEKGWPKEVSQPPARGSSLSRKVHISIAPPRKTTGSGALTSMWQGNAPGTQARAYAQVEDSLKAAGQFYGEDIT